MYLTQVKTTLYFYYCSSACLILQAEGLCSKDAEIYAELEVNFSHNKMNSLVRNTIKWDTIMVNMAFDRKSGGRKGKVISRIDPFHLEGGQSA